MHATTSSDQALLERIRQADTGAFELLYQQYWHPLFSFANKLLKSYDDAQDVVQIVFISLWEKRHTLAIHQSLESYLFQAVRFQSLKRLEAILKMPEQLDRIHADFMPVFNDILNRLQEQDLLQQIEKEIKSLPRRTQEIFLLSRHQKLSIPEIARLLNISEQTVKNQLHLALKALRHSIALLIIFHAR
jgi:RNA polymerase sigma-70 factor (ECF subfamily)